MGKTEKKRESGLHVSKKTLFWRIQGECWRRMVTPSLMYLFMSLLAFSVQAIVPGSTSALEIVLGVICIAGGAFFNGHLCYHYGKLHYDAYLTGNIHRRNAIYGYDTGGDHRVELEFRPWKGFYIGFLIGLPVILLGILAHYFYDVASFWFLVFLGWAFLPLTWFGTAEGGGLRVDPLFSLLFILLPILVSGVFYLVGALVEKRTKEEEKTREEAVAAAGKRGKKK